VKIVNNIDTIVVTSPTNEARKKQGNAANSSIKEKLTKDNGYLFEVENVDIP
jgi:hypothetical protein